MITTNQFAKQLALPFGLPSGPDLVVSPPQGAQLDRAFDYMFSHASFCHSAFPAGKPKDEHSKIVRRNGNFALTLTPTCVDLPGEDMDEVCFGVPYGVKPRLLSVWAVTQLLDPSRRPDNNVLELGNVREWFDAIGCPWSGQSINRTKEQLLRLAFVRMTMVMEGPATESVVETALFDGTVLEPGTLRLYKAGDLGSIKWPQALRVNHTMAQTFRRHAVPIPTARLRLVAESPMAMDLLLYFCYRLPFLKQDEHLPFAALAKRFGDGIAPSKFRLKFLNALKDAQAAYPEAKIEVSDTEGLILHKSDPAELREAYRSFPRNDSDTASATGKPKWRRNSSRRFLNADQLHNRSPIMPS